MLWCGGGPWFAPLHTTRERPMYITSTVRLPSLTIGEFELNCFGMEPVLVPDQIIEPLGRTPFSGSIFAEDVPEVFKKKYYKGCLEGTKGKKLLVIRYGGIGDIMWVLPAIQELKNRFGVIVRFACFEKDRELFYESDLVDDVITTHYPTVNDVKWADYVLDFFDTVEGIGTDEAKVRNPVDINAEIIGYKIKEPVFKININAIEERRAKNILISLGIKPDDKIIGFPLTASSPHRTWYKQAELIKMLLDYDKKIKIIVFGKENVDLLVTKIRDIKSDRILDLSNTTSLREFISLLNECNVVMSNDTSAVHLSAGLGKSVVAIYSTVPAYTRTSHYPTVAGIEVKKECSPCYKLSEHCPNIESCLATINVEEVFNEIIKKL